MQNPQFSFQIFDDNADVTNILLNIQALQAQMFVPISPNVNWKNCSNLIRTKKLFRSISPHIHISADSSATGNSREYFIKQLIGGTAIITTGIWSTKVSYVQGDDSEFGSFTITTLQGKNQKRISFIAAYIAVNKGSNIGIDSLFAQQTTIYEQNCLLQNRIPDKKYCPRKHAIQRLDDLISSLQPERHAIILMLDANQTPKECYSSCEIKPYTIEWLKERRGLNDPFIDLCGAHPNSTTQIPFRDIEYVLTYGVNSSSISTLGLNNPAPSDHFGICFDNDMVKFFNSSYSNLSTYQPRGLASGHGPSVSPYMKYVNEQIASHNLWKRTVVLHDLAKNNPQDFTNEHIHQLNNIDSQLTVILLAGERLCSKKNSRRQAWSPFLQNTALHYSYWRQKFLMSQIRLFHWEHLNKIRQRIRIEGAVHSNTDPEFIHNKLRLARLKWKKCKKQSKAIRDQLLTEKAELLASKLRTSEEKALQAIKKAEASRYLYLTLNELLGKQRKPLTQVDIRSQQGNPSSQFITVTTKDELERAILDRNKRHSKQSLKTPFMNDPFLSTSIDPSIHDNLLDQLFRWHIC